MTSYVYILIKYYPGRQWDIRGNDYSTLVMRDGGPKPRLSSLEARHALYLDELESMEYKRLREKEYPSIEEQLDMIYHDMAGWRKSIKAVKDKHPKPGRE